MNKCRILTLLLSWSCSNEVPHGNQGNHGALSFGGTAGDLIGVTAREVPSVRGDQGRSTPGLITPSETCCGTDEPSSLIWNILPCAV